MEQRRQRTVVIVEGHRGVREALASRLAAVRGVDTIAAASTAEAGEALVHRYAPAVVLYDPGTIAGTIEEVVWRLGWGGCPVVAVAASMRDDEYHALKRAGTTAILLMGEDTPRLIETVQQALAPAGKA